MRIAVPTNDGTNVSEHFGRSAAFVVFDIENGCINRREVRANAGRHTQDQGACGHGGETHAPHDHAGILTALSGCEAVICTGMGWRAAEALKSAGIIPVMVDFAGSVDAAVGAYVRGEIGASSTGYCKCQH